MGKLRKWGGGGYGCSKVRVGFRLSPHHSITKETKKKAARVVRGKAKAAPPTAVSRGACSPHLSPRDGRHALVVDLGDLGLGEVAHEEVLRKVRVGRESDDPPDYHTIRYGTVSGAAKGADKGGERKRGTRRRTKGSAGVKLSGWIFAGKGRGRVVSRERYVPVFSWTTVSENYGKRDKNTKMDAGSLCRQRTTVKRPLDTSPSSRTMQLPMPPIIDPEEIQSIFLKREHALTLLRPLEGDQGGDPAPHAPADDDHLLVRLWQQLVDQGDRVLLPPAACSIWHTQNKNEKRNTRAAHETKTRTRTINKNELSRAGSPILFPPGCSECGEHTQTGLRGRAARPRGEKNRSLLFSETLRARAVCGGLVVSAADTSEGTHTRWWEDLFFLSPSLVSIPCSHRCQEQVSVHRQPTPTASQPGTFSRKISDARQNGKKVRDVTYDCVADEDSRNTNPGGRQNTPHDSSQLVPPAQCVANIGCIAALALETNFQAPAVESAFAVSDPVPFPSREMLRALS